jgi:hypothetical protein
MVDTLLGQDTNNTEHDLEVGQALQGIRRETRCPL